MKRFSAVWRVILMVTCLQFSVFIYGNEEEIQAKFIKHAQGLFSKTQDVHAVANFLFVGLNNLSSLENLMQNNPLPQEQADRIERDQLKIQLQNIKDEFKESAQIQKVISMLELLADEDLLYLDVRKVACITPTICSPSCLSKKYSCGMGFSRTIIGTYSGYDCIHGSGEGTDAVETITGGCLWESGHEALIDNNKYISGSSLVTSFCFPWSCLVFSAETLAPHDNVPLTGIGCSPSCTLGKYETSYTICRVISCPSNFSPQWSSLAKKFFPLAQAPSSMEMSNDLDFNTKLLDEAY